MMIPQTKVIWFGKEDPNLKDNVDDPTNCKMQLNSYVQCCAYVMYESRKKPSDREFWPYLDTWP